MTDVLTPDEVALLLRVPRSRVLELIRGGAIEVVVLGPRTKRIRADCAARGSQRHSDPLRPSWWLWRGLGAL